MPKALKNRLRVIKRRFYDGEETPREYVRKIRAAFQKLSGIVGCGGDDDESLFEKSDKPVGYQKDSAARDLLPDG